MVANAMTIDTSELTLMFNEFLIIRNSTKKGFMTFFHRDVTAFHEVPLTSFFPSRNITKYAETHPPPMRDVIIEQPHGGTGWISEKTEAFYVELNKRTEATTNNFSSVDLLINHD